MKQELSGKKTEASWIELRATWEMGKKESSRSGIGLSRESEVSLLSVVIVSPQRRTALTSFCQIRRVGEIRNHAHEKCNENEEKKK